uniref:Transmembrane protein n=1 Tax=Medicago truncatula TaxID=3880 RepID=I3T6U5_MEDTR|nr:unknown [Medicago truncatula]
MSRGKSFTCYEESISLLSFLQIVTVVTVLLLHHHHQTCDAITNTNNQTYCPPSSCGKITNISHPFRLMNDPTSE